MSTPVKPSKQGPKIALVGHCGPDSSYLRMVAAKAAKDVQVLSADDAEELKRILDDGVDLLLLNRQLDYGFDEREGVDLIRKLNGRYPRTKLMLVSNYPESQAAAVAAGALPGFGKRDLRSPHVVAMLGDALRAATADAAATTSI